MYKYSQPDRVFLTNRSAITFGVPRTHGPAIMLVMDVPICEIPSLFDIAVLVAAFLKCNRLSFWQNGRETILGVFEGSHRRTQEPEEWRRRKSFPITGPTLT